MKNYLLFSMDAPEKRCDLIRKLYDLENFMVLRICNMRFEQVRNFLIQHRSCIVLFSIENSKGLAIDLLRDVYNCSFNVPYMIVLYKTGNLKFLKHIESRGASKLFCVDSEDYSDDLVVEWVIKTSKGLMMDVIFPFSESYIESSIRYKISDKLKKMGMLSCLTGYSYVVDAIELYIQNSELCITRDVYTILAKRYRTTCMCIDRCMRHAIEIVWRDTKLECLKEYYPDVAKVYENRPSVLEFVSCMADSLKQEVM